MKKVMACFMKVMNVCLTSILGKYHKVVLISILLTTVMFLSLGTALGASIEIKSFYPRGACGLFWNYENVQVTINGVNNTTTAQTFTVTFVITDFNGNQIGNSVMENFTVNSSPNNNFSRNVNIGLISGVSGWFCIRATLEQNGTQIDQRATGCCVFESITVNNSFFSNNACGSSYDGFYVMQDGNKIIDAMRRVGVNGKDLAFKLGSVPQSWSASGYLNNLISPSGSYYPYWNSSLELVGYIQLDEYWSAGLPSWHKAESDIRVSQGVSPYSEAYYTEFGNFIAAIATTYGTRISKWVISDEYDVTFTRASRTPTDFRPCEVERYIRQAQIAYQQLKSVNPNCTVTALTASTSDMLQSPPFYWKIAQDELLPSTAALGGLNGHFDKIGPDAYCGGVWYFTNSNIDSAGPEKYHLRETLQATVDLQKSLNNGIGQIGISEHSWFVPFHYEPDNATTKRVSYQMARYIILAKTVPEVTSLSILAMASGAAYAVYYKGLVSTDASPVFDCGQWKVEISPTGTPYAYPRPWVAVLSTMSRLFADVLNPVQANTPEGYCAWAFDKSTGGAVAALWTVAKGPYTITVNLPAGYTYTRWDIMGNSQSLNSGSNTLSVSECPFFIVCNGGANILKSSLDVTTDMTPINFKLNEGTGTAVNAETPYNALPTIIAGTTYNMNPSTCWVNGVNGNALNFDGVNDNVQIPYNTIFDITNDGVTYAAWIKPSSFAAGTYNMIISRGFPYLGTYGDNLIFRTIVDGVSTPWFLGTSHLPVGKWSHVAAVLSRYGYIKLYVNGKEDRPSIAYTGTNMYQSGSATYIGSHVSTTYPFAGIIDEVEIYRTGLSTKAIRRTKDRRIIEYDFPLNETSGNTVYDSFDASRSAALNGAILTPAGVDQGGLYLDGINDYAEISSSNNVNLTGNEGFSFSAWLKAGSFSTGSYNMVISKGSPYLGVYNGKAVITVKKNDATTVWLGGNTILQTGKWYHIAGTFDADKNLKLYVNGVQDASTSVGSSLTVNSGNLFIGRHGVSALYYFNGIIDNVRIYKKGLSAEEIQLLYENKE